jgi:hypothetical protein
MKRSFAILSFLVICSANAGIDTTKKYQHPGENEIQQSRACFQDLETLGCGKQEEDHERFRSCVADVQDKLDEPCKKIMLDLYGE